MVFALKTQRMYRFKHFDIMTENTSVVYLKSNPSTSKHGARRVELLADYDFTVHHRAGNMNIADSISGRPGLELNGIEYSLGINPSTASTIAAGYDGDIELFPILKRLGASCHNTLHSRYVWNASEQSLYI